MSFQETNISAEHSIQLAKKQTISAMSSKELSAMSESLPVEITTDIMSRLPPKSIATCTAVCKSWNSLIKSSAFVSHHLSRMIQWYRRNNVHILLIREQKAVYSLYRNNYSALGTDQYVEFPYPSKYVDKLRPFHCFGTYGWYQVIAGTCNGVICLAACGSEYSDCPIIIWNPTVRKFVILPVPSITTSFGSRKTHAFGHDMRNNDYKVLRILTNEREAEPLRAEIYSLARGSWRSLAGSVPSCFKLSRESSFINGASHWIQGFDMYGKKREDEEYMIVLFDMATELFGEMQMPEALRKYVLLSYITNYEECLALIIWGLDFLQVWVMKEYGVVESWTRLYMISGLPRIPILPPFGFKSSCELLVGFGRFPNFLQVVNFDDGKVKDFEIDEHYTSTRLYEPVSLNKSCLIRPKRGYFLLNK